MRAAVRATSVSLAMARSRWPDFVEMTKPRVGAMVLVTTMVGFYLGLTEPVGWPAVWLLAEVLFGTALVAGGANVLNQFLEREQDAKMRRTRGRPLPTGRVLPGEAIWFGCVCATVGVALLAVQLNGLTALVAGLTCGLYVLVYTPLKLRTPASLLVGAVPGALPPVIGWVAAAGRVEVGSLVIFSILFCWQVPHFLSIAWVYRSDYSAGGYAVLPVVDPSGGRSARGIVLFSVMLLAVSLDRLVPGPMTWPVTKPDQTVHKEKTPADKKQRHKDVHPVDQQVNRTTMPGQILGQPN